MYPPRLGCKRADCTWLALWGTLSFNKSCSIPFTLRYSHECLGKYWLYGFGLIYVGQQGSRGFPVGINE